MNFRLVNSNYKKFVVPATPSMVHGTIDEVNTAIICNQGNWRQSPGFCVSIHAFYNQHSVFNARALVHVKDCIKFTCVGILKML